MNPHADAGERGSRTAGCPARSDGQEAGVKFTVSEPTDCPPLKKPVRS